MNYGRPEQLRDQLLPALVGYPQVAQVIVAHAKQSSAELVTPFKHQKVVHRLDCEAKAGHDPARAKG